MWGSKCRRAARGGTLSLLVLLACAAISPAIAATPGAVMEFHIPPSDLSTALLRLSTQAHLQLSSATSEIDGLTTNGLSGKFTVDEALQRLLASTGLDYRVSSGVITVKARKLSDPPSSGPPDPPAGAAPTPAVADEAPVKLNEVTVTGTRIQRNGYQAPTPVTTIGSAELAAQAPVNIADFINKLPALSGSLTPTSGFKSISSGESGLNLLNLRNLGTERTLVLVDGERWVTSDVNGETDINNIPQGLVQRVDIVTGGASATYGSDAIAGVVNFILDKNFTGFKGELSGGETTYGDDPNWKASLTFGTGFGADNRGHFLFEADMFDNYGVLDNPRAWARTGWKDINNPNYTPTNGQPRQI